MIRNIATTLLLIAGGFSSLAGFFGLTSTRFTPYHETVVGRDWTQLEPGIQAIILSMQKIEGGGFLATGLAILSLLIPIRRGQLWALGTCAIVVSAHWLPTLYAAITLHTAFPQAQTPALPSAVFIGVAYLAMALFFLDSRSQKNTGATGKA